MKFTQIKETCLYVSDLEKTREFYHNKIGLEVIAFVKDRHIFFRAGSSVLLCFLPEATKNETSLPSHYGYGKMHFAFETTVKEYEQWKEKIKGSGIRIEQEQEWTKGLKSFYFRDPDEHLLEIIEKGVWDREIEK
jgi:catechol 2,3-dioxygenase-like lactoylglutathione lyase family enzyme